jgi:hypothetical protein
VDAIVIRRLTLLMAGVLGLWLILALPSGRVWGQGALVCSAVAAVLCLVPAGITLVWTTRSLVRPADQQLILLLGGTGLRMFVVLAVSLLLYRLIPYLQDQPGFWIWVLIFYLFTLALEMTLVLSGRPAENTR